MSTDLAVRSPELVRLDTEQIQYLAHTEFVPERIRGNLPMIFATIATGREIGIGDMAALKHVHIIDGKPGFSAEIMVALVRRAGHSIVGSTSATEATVTGTRADSGDSITYTFTIEMAQRIQTRVKGGGKIPLAEKEAWRNFPESMLWARAVSQVCRMLFADCTAGFTYTPEELEQSDPGDAALSSGSVTAGTGSESSSAGDPTAVEADQPPVPQAATHEPASPAEQLIAAAEGLQPANMGDPEIPFGDAPPPPVVTPWEKLPATAAQKKKLNVLVGKLRPEHISTEQLWSAMARDLDDPDPDWFDGTRLRWSPLRDSLTKAEAHALIDRLETFAKVKLGDAA